MPDPEDQLYWSASLGLDLADRAVLEAEVLVWRIVWQKSALRQDFLNRKESDEFQVGIARSSANF
jgi:hypothetical protein